MFGPLVPHLRYARYLFLHKVYVARACLRYGIPLAGLTHDLSKFLPDEWFPYVMSFYGPQPRTEKTKISYNIAWLYHQNRNPHHYQYWILIRDDGREFTLEMPLRYRKEMLADWEGAGRVKGKTDILSWYLKHRHEIKLAPVTRQWVEDQLGVSREE